MPAFISVIARFGLAAVWLYSGAVKLMNPLDSRLAVDAYGLVPAELVDPVSVGLPVVELVLGLMLLLGVFIRFAAVGSALLLICFMAGIAWAWSRGLQIDCGCFGGGGPNPDAGAGTYLSSLARDSLFLAAAVWTSWRPFTRFAVRP